MLVKTFKCQMCGSQFEIEVLDRENPRERHVTGYPVVCEKCGSQRLEQVAVRRKAG
jgi:C4-type Zn-finger protein